MRDTLGNTLLMKVVGTISKVTTRGSNDYDEAGKEVTTFVFLVWRGKEESMSHYIGSGCSAKWS